MVVFDLSLAVCQALRSCGQGTLLLFMNRSNQTATLCHLPVSYSLVDLVDTACQACASRHELLSACDCRVLHESKVCPTRRQPAEQLKHNNTDTTNFSRPFVLPLYPLDPRLLPVPLPSSFKCSESGILKASSAFFNQTFCDFH